MLHHSHLSVPLAVTKTHLPSEVAPVPEGAEHLTSSRGWGQSRATHMGRPPDTIFPLSSDLSLTNHFTPFHHHQPELLHHLVTLMTV